MTYKDAVNEFKSYHLELGVYDYWTIEEMWSAYIDGLCKGGEITQKQYDTWATPFEYGKPVTVYKRKVVSQR